MSIAVVAELHLSSQAVRRAPLRPPDAAAQRRSKRGLWHALPAQAPLCAGLRAPSTGALAAIARSDGKRGQVCAVWVRALLTPYT